MKQTLAQKRQEAYKTLLEAKAIMNDYQHEFDKKRSRYFKKLDEFNKLDYEYAESRITKVRAKKNSNKRAQSADKKSKKTTNQLMKMMSNLSQDQIHKLLDKYTKEEKEC